jgi:Helix-turn-helix domain
MENDKETSQLPSFDKRMVYSPGEFAALFGKHQTWGYRQLYRGTIKAITQCGRIMIPRSEVDRLLSSAKVYAGKVQPQRSRRSGIRRSALQSGTAPNDQCG